MKNIQKRKTKMNKSKNLLTTKIISMDVFMNVDFKTINRNPNDINGKQLNV